MGAFPFGVFSVQCAISVPSACFSFVNFTALPFCEIATSMFAFCECGTMTKVCFPLLPLSVYDTDFPAFSERS